MDYSLNTTLESTGDLILNMEGLDGDQVSLPASSYLLSLNSLVFKTMLQQQGFVEGSSKNITINGISVNTMVIILEFLKTKKLPLVSLIEAIELLKAAHYYEFHEVVTIVSGFMDKYLNISNAIDLYELAGLYSLSSLKEESFSLLVRSAFIIYGSGNHLKASKATLESMLGSQHLNLPEPKVVDMMWSWATHQCRLKGQPLVYDLIRGHLEKPLLKDVRWADKVGAECSKNVPAKLLDEIALFRKTRRTASANKRKPRFTPSLLKYSTEFKLSTLCEFDVTVVKAVSDETNHCFVFSGNKDFFIVGFTLYVVKGCEVSYRALENQEFEMWSEDSSGEIVNYSTTCKLLVNPQVEKVFSHALIDVYFFKAEFLVPFLVQKNVIKSIVIRSTPEYSGLLSLPVQNTTKLTITQNNLKILLHSNSIMGIIALDTFECREAV